MFSIYDGREYFYQWDLDRKLIVYDETIKEVHFCNKTDDCSLVCEVYTEGNLRLVNVPNILLQDNWRINVYGYDDKYTKHEKKYDVKSRTRPADYIYTETEIKTFGTLEKRMEELENAVSVEGIEEAVKDYLEENPETFVVTVGEHDGTYPLTYSTDKTSLEIMQAWRDGKTIFCKYNKSGISLVLTLSLVTRDYAYFFQNGGLMDINGFKIRSGFGVCIQGSTVTTCDFQPAYLQDIQSSSGGVIYVNLQEQENGTATADMTSEEIYSAYMENKYIVCKYDTLLLPLVLCNQETAIFILNWGEETLAVNISGNIVEYSSTEIYATKDDLARVIEEANQYFATKEEIPSIEGLASIDYVDEAISNIDVSGGSGGNVDQSFSVFKNKTAFFYGDSLTEANYHYTKGYHSWVKDLLGLASYNNYGVSGYKVSDVYNKVKSVTGTADIVFVMCGVNDQTFSVPLGTMGDNTTGTTYGSLDLLCALLKQKYPTSIVVFITPHYQTNYPHSDGITSYEVSKAIKEVCEKYAIPVYDNFVLSGIYPSNLSYFTTDRCHWNDITHEMVGKNLSKWVTDTFGYLYGESNDDASDGEETKTLTSITAVFEQGDTTIYTTDILDSLKSYLTVRANYDDGSSEAVTAYTLSGSLNVGVNTITVSYAGKTTTFTVTVLKGTETVIYASDRTLQSGYYYNGKHNNSSNHCYTDNIPVPALTEIQARSNLQVGVALFDTDGNYIENISAYTGSGKGQEDLSDFTFTTPANCGSLILNVWGKTNSEYPSKCFIKYYG
jgi:lysophospholipase L1-like esterase